MQRLRCVSLRMCLWYLFLLPSLIPRCCPIVLRLADAVPKKRGPKTEVLEELLKRIDGLEKRLGENDSGSGSGSKESPDAEDSNMSSVATRGKEAMSPPPETGPSPIVVSPALTATTDQRLISRLVDIFFERVNGKPYTLFHEGVFRQDWADGRIPSYILDTVCAVSVRWVR